MTRAIRARIVSILYLLEGDSDLANRAHDARVRQSSARRRQIAPQEVRRRPTLPALVCLVLFTVFGPVAARAQTADVDFDISLDHVALSVPDISASIAWYSKMFGFKEVAIHPSRPHERRPDSNPSR
jgi:glyoxalase/bleomycin resistance protein/dioxygenase superfamily protein